MGERRAPSRSNAHTHRWAVCRLWPNSQLTAVPRATGGLTFRGAGVRVQGGVLSFRKWPALPRCPQTQRHCSSVTPTTTPPLPPQPNVRGTEPSRDTMLTRQTLRAITGQGRRWLVDTPSPATMHADEEFASQPAALNALSWAASRGLRAQ